MRAFPDTSFLCALYRKQENSVQAAAWMKNRRDPLRLSWLVLWEFRHSTRLQTWLHKHDRRKGFPVREGAAMLAAIQSDLKAGVLEVIEVDWADVHLIAERLSGKHADARGIRAMDTLHLASAIHLGARILLSSDVRQRRIAELEGMQSAP